MAHTRNGSAAITAALLVLVAAPADAQTAAEDLFRAQCASCHTIGGGPLTGPDLKGVTSRKDRAWLEHFIQDPPAVLASGDPYALELQRAARGAVMPRIAAVTPAAAKDLLDLIEAEGAKEVSPFRGAAAEDRPVLPADIQAGHDLFTGERPLSAGGPACVTCHDVSSIQGLGGGRLGPNLDGVVGRLGGRRALSAWLTAPAAPTMKPIYAARPLTADEVFALSAFFEDVARSAPAPRGGAGLLGFVFAGIVGAGALLGLGDLLWKERRDR